MPPLPAVEPFSSASPDLSSGQETHTNLSRLRQGWSQKFQEMESLPTDVQTSVGATTKPQQPQDSIPELPSLGAMASRAAMSMNDLDAFLAKYHQQGPEAPATGASRVSWSLPEMPASVELPLQSKATKKEDLPTLPSSPIPEISMPQIRDQFLAKSDESADVHTPPAPDLTDLRKTAPQFTKFSPDPIDTGEDPPAAPEDPSTDDPVAEKPDYTDEDLREALQPIIDPVVDQFLYTPSQGIHTYLEPMLRSTVRRAIAEQMEDVSPFRDVSGWDKFAWKVRALFSSRTYDDIVFDYTRRYQVEEVYLLRPHSRSLISYASHDPARHTKPERVQGTVKKIASKESEHKNEDTPWIKWKDTRNLMIRRGEHCILAAIVHGPSNAILRADLDYALRQAEERFGKALKDESDIHMQILQPLLEGCLLIQAPAIPN